MFKHLSSRRMHACLRIVGGYLCLLAMVLSTGPVRAAENLETSIPVESKESCKESVVGVDSRLVRIRILWTTAHRMPAGHGYVRPSSQQIDPSLGHTLSHELLAPLRC